MGKFIAAHPQFYLLEVYYVGEKHNEMKQPTQENEFQVLLIRYLENQCTTEEVQALIEWIKSEDDHTCFDLVSKSSWEALAIDRSNLNSDQEELLRVEAKKLLQKIENKERYHSRRKVTFTRIWFSGAAAIVVLVLLSGLFYYSQYFKKAEILDNTPVSQKFVADNGQLKEVKLNDGTFIILNSGSSLVVSNDYNVRSRTVSLNGEGFFKVAKNPQKPFIIHSGSLKVKVLGTSFNVNSYVEDRSLSVTVSTGRVLVNIDEKKLQLQLLPNEHLYVDKKSGVVQKDLIGENNYTKWIDGYLYFDKEPLDQVIKTINRRYNKHVVLHCDSSKILISGMHDNKNLQSVLDAICFIADLKQRSDGEKIILYN